MGTWCVRQSLASSMHEVAAIIGEKNTDLYLVPVFEQFMKDVEEVKLGILRHLSEFFRSVSKEMRGKLLSVLATLLHSDSENEKNWRFRYEYTWQCVFLSDLYDMEEINTYIAAIALTLANGEYRIALIRKVASYLLSKILGSFLLKDRQHCLQKSTSGTSDSVVHYSSITITFVRDIVKGFARSKNWRRRQT
ncbi:unnamed protein product [Enterobius vermicularis]|uniref:HEAT repeat-containing protein 1 n=1 Tax=Enterobius vermicularis TaxID=51028 RepID=A0A0N4UZC9_ENTVE|nr:unnamed protein product [Enterobius vermicularis]